jgi:hypothetical protein
MAATPRRRRRRAAGTRVGIDLDRLTVRRLADTEGDRAAIARLAGLDSSDPLTGEVLVAELDGRPVAAVSIADGAVIADPFTRTDQIRSLLELRASQVRESGDRHGGRRRKHRRLVPNARRG